MSECKDIHLALTASAHTSIVEDGSSVPHPVVLPVSGADPAFVHASESFEDVFFAIIALIVFGGGLLVATPLLGAHPAMAAGAAQVAPKSSLPRRISRAVAISSNTPNGPKASAAWPFESADGSTIRPVHAASGRDPLRAGAG